MRKQIILVAMLVSPVVACGGPGDDPDASESGDIIDVLETSDAGLDSVESDVCVPLCESRGRECGDDGCGGSCGICEVGECRDGACWEDFGPCEYLECGESGGENCGTCDPGWECQNHSCVHTACDGKECGDDGFGGDCGDCLDGSPCYMNTCMYIEIPDCEGKECGDDGHGGSCGECLDGRVCIEMIARCLFPACVYPDELPAAWGKASILNSLHVPVNSGEESVCRDYTGDGVPDSALTGMALQMNPGFEDIATWNTALVMEFSGVDDFVDAADFVLNGLYGDAVSGSMSGTDVELFNSSYMTDSCMPYIRFAHAAIAGGVVSGFAGRASIFINVAPSFVLQVDLIDVFVGGTVAVDGDGVAVTGGSFSAVLTSANYYKAMEDIEAECAKDPVPEGMDTICGAIAMSQPRIVGPGAVLFNMHRNDDGSYINKDAENAGNAASLCLTFTAGPAVITGYRQP